MQAQPSGNHVELISHPGHTLHFLVGVRWSRSRPDHLQWAVEPPGLLKLPVAFLNRLKSSEADPPEFFPRGGLAIGCTHWHV